MTFGEILYYFIAAAVATAGFSMMFRTQHKSLLPGAIIGGIGYVLYELIVRRFGSAAVASFAAALFVGLASELTARLLKCPAIVYATAGIIPLVPGAWLYRTMLDVVNADYSAAIAVGLETIMIAGAIAMALGFSTVVARGALYLRKKKAS